jgi:hypothetical protein
MTLFFTITLLQLLVTLLKFVEMSKVCDVANRQKDNLIFDVVTNCKLIALYNTHKAKIDKVAKVTEIAHSEYLQREDYMS